MYVYIEIDIESRDSITDDEDGVAEVAVHVAELLGGRCGRGYRRELVQRRERRILASRHQTDRECRLHWLSRSRLAPRRERSGDGAALEARRDRCPAERATACKQHERVGQAIGGLGDGGQRGGGEEGPLGLRGWRRRWQPPPPLQGMGMERRRF